VHQVCSIFVVLSLRSVSAYQCSQEVNEAIQRCVVPVAEYAETLGMGGRTTPGDGDGTPSLLPSMNSNVFQELCKLINAFDRCVAEPKERCPQHITLNLIDASYGYLCNEGYKTFMQNADCLMRLDQEVRIRRCHDSTMQTIRDVNSRPNVELERKLNDMCKSLNYFTRCVEQPVLTECGESAWGVILRVLRDTTQTLIPTCAIVTDVRWPATIESPQSSSSSWQNEEPVQQQRGADHMLQQQTGTASHFRRVGATLRLMSLAFLLIMFVCV